MPLFNTHPNTQTYAACIFLANSGAPTHNSSGAWQHIGGGGGTDTWTVESDVRPTGVTAQADATTGTAKLTCRKTGLYYVDAHAYFSSIADAKSVGIAVWKNGVEAFRHLATSGVISGQGLHVAGVIPLVAGDYLQPYVYQDDSASEAYLVSKEFYNRLAMTYVGPNDSTGPENQFDAAMYLANSGAPTNTDTAAWQHAGAGGGTDTWTSEYDIRSDASAAQVDTTTGTAKLTCRRTGIYALSASVTFGSLATGVRYGAGIGYNGAIKWRTLETTGLAAGVSSNISVHASLVAGDTLTLMGFQTDTASEAYLVSDSIFNRITMSYIGPAT